MSLYGSQRGLNMMGRRSGSRSEINAGATYQYARSEVMQPPRGNNGFTQEMENFNRTSPRGFVNLVQVPAMSPLQQRISFLQAQCQDYLERAASIFKSGGDNGAMTDAHNSLLSAGDIIDELKMFAIELNQQNLPSESLMRSVTLFSDQFRDLSMALNAPPPAPLQQTQRFSSRSMRRSVSREEPNRFYTDAMSWITQQRRLIETSAWGDDLTAVEQQISNHSSFHNSIQNSMEMNRARTELMRGKDADVNKSLLNKLEQEWDGLQNSSHQRSVQLQDLRNIIGEISDQIMWVNDREEEELVFDWGDKRIDNYIPQKQESFSKLMSELEQKEIQLNVLKAKVDFLLKNKHPASDKIQAYMETLQTQWSWLLQITRCIGVHLKENARYSQFFKETGEMNSKLKLEHDNIRQSFSCDKSTALHKLLELQQGLERERERLTEQREMVQQLVLKSKSIVRLKPRNPEEKITGPPVVVQALCDFRQDEKTIRKGDEGILKDNSERTTWQVTGPGGMDMQVPSVCLLVPPPNPLAISLASKNSQYYEAILSVWNQLYINVKSMISWQYCLLDIGRINSLTMSMLSKMGPDESNNILRSLEMHFQEFKRHSQGSELFGAEDQKLIENQFAGAQQHFDKLVVDLPTYAARGEGSEYSAAVSVKMLNELNALRLKLDGAESSLISFLYIALGDDGLEECGQHISSTQAFQKNIQGLRGEFVSLRDGIQAELKDAGDSDKGRYLSGQLDIMNQRLLNLDSYFTTHLQRLDSVKSLLKDMMKAEDVVKVYEARLTEKETASSDPEEVQRYQKVLLSMRSDLEQKQDLLNSLVVDLNQMQKVNDQRDQGRYQCIINLTQYADHVHQLSDRWKRIHVQINNRLVDLDSYLPQLKRYMQSSSQLSGWIDETQKQIDSQHSVKMEDSAAYTQLLNQQKALNSDIKAKRELMETVHKDGETCISAIKNYELELATYSAGLETLLNIPIKRTVLQSPSSSIAEEVSSLNAHYLELLTRSSDYYKLLLASQKNMEELKIRNTRIELLEEELEQLRDAIKDQTANNSSLQDALLQYQQELNNSQSHLLSLEEVKRTETMKCMATQESLDSSKDRLEELTEEVRRLKLQLEDMERKKKIVEERYTFLQEEHDETMRKKLKELEQASWAKMELEKTVSERNRELERLRKELEDEARRIKEAQTELAKVRQEHSTEIREVKQTYESQILVAQSSMQKLSQEKESDSAAMSLEFERLEGESSELKEQLKRLRISLSQEEAQRRILEEEVKRLTALNTEESRKRHELESQIQVMMSQKREGDNKMREVQESSSRTLQDKINEINRLTRNFEEERRLKRSLETDKRRLEGDLAVLKSKNETTNEELVQLRSSHRELSLIRVELEAHALEKGRSEQTIARLQARIQELQEELKRLEGELEKQRQVAEEEAGKRRRTESQLEKSSQAMREYTTTITTLRTSQEETNIGAKHADEKCKQLQEALDRASKENKVTSQNLAALKAEINTLKLQLTQEQGRVQDSNQRYEALHRSMEEKSCALNVSSGETERLQRLTETLTTDRQRVEEELRTVRLEHEELLKNKKRGDREMTEQITALQKQLDSSQRAGAEHDRLMRQLSREREKLQVEIENVQKQAREVLG